MFRFQFVTKLRKKQLIIYIAFGVLIYFFIGHPTVQRLLSKCIYTCDELTKQKAVIHKLCHNNFYDTRIHFSDKTDLKMIYFVTPTYPRPEQVPELTRLAHTLMHVPRLHWIVADDQPECSDRVLNILSRSKLPYTHLSTPKPYTYKCRYHAKGVTNRIAAMDWLLYHKKEGILYFGDDDNAIDLQLFDEIRNTEKISMFPVGLIGRYGISSPIVKNGRVSAFFDSWPARRKFPVDMAGFAINTDLLNRSTAMPYQSGYQETMFLRNLGIKYKDIQPLAENCSKVLVWHTVQKRNKKHLLKINITQLDNVFVQEYPSFVNLLKEVHSLGIAVLNSKAGLTLTIRNRSTYGTLLGFN